MLLNPNNTEAFTGKTRGEINHIAGGKSPAGMERRQAELLASIREVHTLHHNKQQGFSLGERARLI